MLDTPSFSLKCETLYVFDRTPETVHTRINPPLGLTEFLYIVEIVSVKCTILNESSHSIKSNHTSDFDIASSFKSQGNNYIDILIYILINIYIFIQCETYFHRKKFR